MRDIVSELTDALMTPPIPDNPTISDETRGLDPRKYYWIPATALTIDRTFVDLYKATDPEISQSERHERLFKAAMMSYLKDHTHDAS